MCSSGADEHMVLAYQRMRWGIDVQKAGMDLLCNIQIVHTDPRNELEGSSNELGRKSGR
jgi:hypothetical protein